MAVTDLTIITRSLTSRAFSTVVTALTVAVGVTLVLVLLSMKDAGEKAFSRGTGNMHFLITRDAGELASVLNGVYFADVPNAAIPYSEYEQLRQQYPFAWAIPTVMGDSYRDFPVVGTTPEMFESFVPAENTPFVFAEGEPFEAGETGQIVIGADVAARGLSMGDTISFTHGGPRSESMEVHDAFRFEVVGILEPTSTPFDRAVFTSLQSSWLVHAQDRINEPGAVATADDITEADRQVTGIYARLLSRGGATGAAPAALQSIFERIRREGRYTIAAPEDQVRNLFSIVGNVNVILVALAVSVLVSSGITLMLALYNTMEQRRRQIAVLRVLGCSRMKVFGLVISESAVLGLIGAAVGVALSLVAAEVVAGALFSTTGVVVEPSLSSRWALGVVTGVVVLAAIAGLIPAATAYQTSVVRNLRPQG